VVGGVKKASRRSIVGSLYWLHRDGPDLVLTSTYTTPHWLCSLDIGSRGGTITKQHRPDDISHAQLPLPATGFAQKRTRRILLPTLRD
jgi:hypothetical protein